MTQLLNPLIQRFSERTPVPVMVRSVLERCLHAPYLDEWFEQASEGQYTRELLFSTVFDLATQVVFRHQPSLHAGYQASVQEIGVSVTSVYNKINGIEPNVSAGLVRYTATQGEALIRAMNGAAAPLLPGYRVKVLDGNLLGACQHRLHETRSTTAAPLPGKSLAVLDPALGLITDLLPCEDAYTQERALVPALLETVRAGELWIADRNFCTVAFFQALQERQAAGLIREHEQIRFTPREAVRVQGRIDSGQVGEQTLEIEATATRPALRLRRIVVYLDQPTRDGEDRLYLWTTLPAGVADACTVAQWYAKRWRIEAAFQKLSVELSCEINTLGYPRAALFGFSTAVVAFNALAIVLAALRAAHGQQTVEQRVSSYYLSNEMANMAQSLETILDAEEWKSFQHWTTEAFAAWLVETARLVELRKYRKHPRGLKKPTAKRTHDPNKTPVSTARLLAERKSKRRAP